MVLGLDRVGVDTTVPFPAEPEPEPDPDPDPPVGAAVGMTYVGTTWEGPSAPPEEATAPPVAAVEMDDTASETTGVDSGEVASVVLSPVGTEESTDDCAVVEDGLAVELELDETALQERS